MRVYTCEDYVKCRDVIISKGRVDGIIINKFPYFGEFINLRIETDKGVTIVPFRYKNGSYELEHQSYIQGLKDISYIKVQETYKVPYEYYQKGDFEIRSDGVMVGRKKHGLIHGESILVNDSHRSRVIERVDLEDEYSIVGLDITTDFYIYPNCVTITFY